MNTNYPWNAIYTRANYEQKVSKLLEKRGIEYYYAQNKAFIKNAEQGKTITAPLFPSIIFVQVDSERQLEVLTALPNVTNKVYWQQQPAVFPAAEINLLRNFLETHETVQLVKTGLYKTNNSSPQELHKPHHFSADNIHTITLPSIGYSLSAKAEPVTNIKLLRKSTNSYSAADGLAFILGFKTNNSKFE